MFEDDESRINSVLERVFQECEDLAIEMRRSNNALSDLGMLNLIRERIRAPLLKEVSNIFAENF